MFTTESTVNLLFFKWASPIIQDIQRGRRVEWLDGRSFSGSYTGTLRGYINRVDDDIRQANIRVTLDSGFEHEVMLVDLMNAAYANGYAQR